MKDLKKITLEDFEGLTGFLMGKYDFETKEEVIYDEHDTLRYNDYVNLIKNGAIYTYDFVYDRLFINHEKDYFDYICIKLDALDGIYIKKIKFLNATIDKGFLIINFCE
jgi:hypothetical protein